MATRWTKRPQNLCRSCGYSWYPRGKNLSNKCPNCGGAEVELAIEALLRALGYLIAAPFVLLAIIASLIFRAVAAAAKAISRNTSKAPEQGESVQPVALDLVAGFATRFFVGLLFPFKWLYSVKDDMFVLSDGEEEVNPIAFGLKLVVIFGVSIFVIISLINMFH